ncbi:MAG TPA: MBOAT family O-acyltransferase [Salinivirga sp.]|uniref:MBOAT family O-acyltransferase n=1 Tax=Salinivirga sp. TaxID=1970192 RepID=UPI002B4815CE|nr:MBOAT family O-acyltransferase [Salinivirga sp.]HKK58985.1 MBOAT family O-acyltransferase [Salinivirga sp.]
MQDLLSKIFTYQESVPMIFTHWSFWVFFLAVLAGFSALQKRMQLRNIWLFVVSLFFYYKCGGYYFFLLIFSTIVDYFIGWGIYNSTTPNKRKFLVGLSVFVNLFVLSYFKYAYFYTDLINTILGTDIKVVNYLALGMNEIVNTSLDIYTIILPVGISFYTFQTISYSIDIYRYKVKPVKNILDFGFYVSFFPQLVAGPIVRAAEFVPQIYRKFKLSAYEFGYATFLILNGLVKKIVISDYISVNFVDRVFEQPLLYSGFENLMAVYGYGIQIYCDFSGYTDIAIGVALLLGFRLPVNFRSPYKATSITDFWRRWHISLSSWLKDYLYIPLGGNRRGTVRTYTNLMITMILGGLWHGANMRFIIWGAIHGLALAFDKFIKSVTSFRFSGQWGRALSIFITFHIVSFAWIFFRAQSTEVVGNMLQQIGTDWQWGQTFEYLAGYKWIFLLMLVGFVFHWLPSRVKESYIRWYIVVPWYLKIPIIVIVVFFIFQIQSADIQPFIYFQF